MNRRKFFGVLGQAVGVLVFSNSIFKGISNVAQAADTAAKTNSGGAGAELPMLDPKDTLASAVKYVEDAKKSPASKGNQCSKCLFYAAKGKKNKKDVGTCTIFQGKLVYANAYCNSFNKKA